MPLSASVCRSLLLGRRSGCSVSVTRDTWPNQEGVAESVCTVGKPYSAPPRAALGRRLSQTPLFALARASRHLIASTLDADADDGDFAFPFVPQGAYFIALPPVTGDLCFFSAFCSMKLNIASAY